MAPNTFSDSDTVAEELTDTVDAIKQLQESEKEMSKTLIQSADNSISGSGPVLTQTESDAIISQINNLSATRVNLYQFN